MEDDFEDFKSISMVGMSNLPKSNTVRGGVRKMDLTTKAMLKP